MIYRLSAAALAVICLAPLARAAEISKLYEGDLPAARYDHVTVQTIGYTPGQSSPSHSHDAVIVAYVTKGRIETQVEGEPLKSLGVGESWTEMPGAHHVICRNASATEPAEFLVMSVAPRKGG